MDLTMNQLEVLHNLVEGEITQEDRRGIYGLDDENYKGELQLLRAEIAKELAAREGNNATPGR